MTGIPLIEPETATGPAARWLAEAQQTFGITPNLVKALANSPAALRGFLAMTLALREEGRLSASTRTRIGLLVAQEHRSAYGLSVHSFLAGTVGGLSEREVAEARRGRAEDAKASAVLAYAAALLRGRGAVTALESAAAARDLTAEEQTEVIAQVIVHSLADWLALAAGIPVDWPLVSPDD
ncbi:carboxymuconolactone decarboxylase family protein [Streptacidiphilus anmyonensis]|uniref:carboxymuconolactone decarboxylase family protein n=1 Tax=Streptacidiphilus anmyonensis TaxID=405782 RepID=UPI0005A7379A|nr:carboxymuconolactone decarboxylase family protein [Streptacidiphilus anmyonensis]